MNFIVRHSNQLSTLAKIIDLRYEVLRQPWKQSRESATDLQESECINAYIEKDNKVIACGRLQVNGPGLGQVRYMAVKQPYQGKGLGKLILLNLEQSALIMKLHTIELQARENAVAFYASLGYQTEEKTFKLWDLIQHYRMVKKLG
jgi:N-acetylglutamate synthase-like GNAT family acetyltransferase